MLLDGSPSQSGPGLTAVFDNLTDEQAAGRACVVGLCRRFTPDQPAASVVVGIAKATGMEVRACRSGCAQLVGWVPPSMWIQPAVRHPDGDILSPSGSGTPQR